MMAIFRMSLRFMQLSIIAGILALWPARVRESIIGERHGRRIGQSGDCRLRLRAREEAGEREAASGKGVIVNIYLIRHADALALGERGITQDAGRPLSEDGEIQAKNLGIGLQRKGLRLDKIVTSPF